LEVKGGGGERVEEDVSLAGGVWSLKISKLKAREQRVVEVANGEEDL